MGCPEQILFSQLPVAQVTLDEATGCDEEQDEHIEGSESFVDCGGLLHSKGKQAWGEEHKAVCALGVTPQWTSLGMVEMEDSCGILLRIRVVWGKHTTCQQHYQACSKDIGMLRQPC